MAKIKLYELMKSNEYSTYDLTNIVADFSINYKKSSSDIVFKTGSMIVSALISFSLQTDNVIQKLICNFTDNNLLSLALSLLLHPIIFVVIYYICKYLKKVIDAIFYNDKKTDEKRKTLISLFYRKILNEIFIAFSFEKKASLITNNYRLKTILMLESLKYFEIAYEELQKNNIIEDIPQNISTEYKIYIKELDAELVNNVLLISIETLERIIRFYDPKIKPNRIKMDKCKNNSSKRICKTLFNYNGLLVKLKPLLEFYEQTDFSEYNESQDEC